MLRKERLDMASKISLLFVAAALFCGCVARTVERQTSLPGEFTRLKSADMDKLKAQSPHLKAHMKDGSLYVFSRWDYTKAGSEISGEAQLFDVSRRAFPSKLYTLGLDSVALLETNVISNSGAAVAMTV
ncbi:MAG TPA: hypothetical protein DEP53_10300, partial [Bacteroidetes bacterium]|nr:hypothetical protein [Bacteroidota bacterium]